jgi:hypothetical protein
MQLGLGARFAASPVFLEISSLRFKMYRWFGIYVASLLAIVIGLSVWGCIGLTKHAIVALDAFGVASDGVTQTAAKLNGQRGTIAMADEDIGAVKSLVIHADLVARHEQQQLVTWDDRGTVLFNNLNGTVTDLRATLNATAGTSRQATTDLAIANDAIANLRDVLAESGSTVKDLHAILPDVAATAKTTAATMIHVESIAARGENIAGSVDKMAAHTEKQVDAPVTWKTRIAGIGMDLGKLGIWYLTK